MTLYVGNMPKPGDTNLGLDANGNPVFSDGESLNVMVALSGVRDVEFSPTLTHEWVQPTGDAALYTDFRCAKCHAWSVDPEVSYYGACAGDPESDDVGSRDAT